METRESIPRDGLLRKEHYLVGFACEMDDHVVTIKYKGDVWQRYGVNTPMSRIFHDIDQVIEMAKAVSVEMS